MPNRPSGASPGSSQCQTIRPLRFDSRSHCIWPCCTVRGTCAPAEAPVDVPKLDDRQVDAKPLEAVRLESLTIGAGVNAIKEGAQINFASGVTVVFGENGSGKSGFVRVLKRAAGLRTAEDILPNVRSGGKGAAESHLLRWPWVLRPNVWTGRMALAFRPHSHQHLRLPWSASLLRTSCCCCSLQPAPAAAHPSALQSCRWHQSERYRPLRFPDRRSSNSVHAQTLDRHQSRYA